MKKNVWVLGRNKAVLADAQRRINEGGGMKAFCFMNYDAVERAVSRLASYGRNDDRPSLLLADYESGLEEEFASLYFLKIQPAFAGIPLFIMCNEVSDEIEESCYSLGAAVVLTKPLNEGAMLRIERASWQNEMTRSYEQVLQQQALELESAKEIKRLNEMLESRNQLLHHVFGKYFSEEVMDAILSDPNGSALGGKKTCVTVLMADLRGFTSLSDRLSGEVIIDMLDRFLDEMIRIIKEYSGTVIEIIGDEILAVFGEPVEIERPEEKAIAAAIQMQNAIRRVNKYNISKNYPVIEMGIGIHKGEVFIGNIGSEYMMRYNVIGQAVNLCSRIESYTFGGQILVSLDTVRSIKDECVVGDTFWITMKGVRRQIPICEVTQIDVFGEEPCVLTKEKSQSMVFLKHTPRVMIYVIQDKFIGEFSILAKALEISDTKIMLELDNEDVSAMALYCEVELLKEGHNAYAKVIKVSGNKLLLRFTYKEEHFVETCMGPM